VWYGKNESNEICSEVHCDTEARYIIKKNSSKYSFPLPLAIVKSIERNIIITLQQYRLSERWNESISVNHVSSSIVGVASNFDLWLKLT
jgi:hypothetical protein